MILIRSTFSHVIVEGDAATIIKGLLEDEEDFYPIGPLLDDVKSLYIILFSMNLFGHVGIVTSTCQASRSHWFFHLESSSRVLVFCFVGKFICFMQ